MAAEKKPLSPLEEIHQRALLLSREDRLILVQMLCGEVPHDGNEHEEAWRIEEQNRFEAYLRGEVEPVSLEESKRRMGRA